MRYNNTITFGGYNRNSRSSGDNLKIILWLIGSVIVMVIGGFRYIERMYEKKICTYALNATVLFVDQRTVDHGDDSERTQYRATFGYTYEDTPYIVCGEWTNFSTYRTGQSVVLYVDPNSPERFYNSFQNNELVSDLMMLCGAISLVISAGVLIYRKHLGY